MKITINNTETTATGVLEGRLDTAASAQFAIDIEPLMDQANKHIILDCTGLEFISSSGLRLFLTLRKQTIAKGGDVTIRNCSAEVKQVLAITGFVALFKFE